jgi:hypothetical protein
MTVSVFELEAAGLSAEQIVQVLKTAETERRLRRREQNRINQQNHRACKQKTDDSKQVSADTMTQERKGSIPPKERIFLSSLEESSSLKLEVDSEEQASGRGWNFENFWNLYPQKVGKGDARRAFVRVQKSKSVMFSDLMAGLRRYLAKTDERPWCNPSTWLNQERWTDQPAIGEQNGTRHRPTGDLYSVASDLIGLAEKRERQAIFGDESGPIIDINKNG